MGETYVEYDVQKNESKCIQEGCGKILKGNKISNIKRHYSTVHKIVIQKESSKKVSAFLTLNKEEFLTCCLGLTTVKSIPFSIFDDSDFFIKIIEPYERAYNIKVNRHNVTRLVETSSEFIRSEICDAVKNRLVCLKMDIATRLERSILGINIQYIHDFKIVVHTIGKFFHLGFYAVTV